MTGVVFLHTINVTYEESMSLSYGSKNKIQNIRIVVSKSFLSKIIEPDGYTTKSSLNIYILTYIPILLIKP